LRISSGCAPTSRVCADQYLSYSWVSLAAVEARRFTPCLPVMLRSALAVIMALSPVLLAQRPAPRFIYIYRDSIRSGVDSTYGSIENDGAQICADYRRPNPLYRSGESEWHSRGVVDQRVRVRGGYRARREGIRARSRAVWCTRRGSTTQGRANRNAGARLCDLSA